MLKTEQTILIILILLLYNGELPPYIANMLALFAGLALVTIPQALQRRITLIDFFVRIFKIIGLIIIGWLVWIDRNIEIKLFYYIFLVTIFYDIIIVLGMRYGKKYIDSKMKNIENE